jgi:hypothetical protein
MRALQYRYVNGKFSRLIRTAISDYRRECYIADLTVLEMSSTLALKSRKQVWKTSQYDSLECAFLEDIATGKLRVCTTGKRQILRPRDLIRFAGVIKQRSLKSADALIAVSCLELALELKEEILFYLEDGKLFSILKDIDAFTSVLKLRHLS